MWAGIPTSGWITLWNTLIGSYRGCTQDQFSLQQSRPCQGKWWQAWDRECGKEQHHHPYTANKGGPARRHWGRGGWLLMEGLDQKELTGEQGRMDLSRGRPKPPQFCNTQQSYVLHNLEIRGISWWYGLYIFVLMAGKNQLLLHGWKAFIQLWLSLCSQKKDLLWYLLWERVGPLEEKAKWHIFAMTMTWFFCSYAFVSPIIQISACAQPDCPKPSRTNGKTFSKGLSCEAELFGELPSFWK